MWFSVNDSFRIKRFMDGLIRKGTVHGRWICLQNSFGSIIVLEKPKIKCRLKANIKSLHSILEEKVRKKIKNIQIIILLKYPRLIDYSRNLKLWWKRDFLNTFLNQKINSTFSNVFRVCRQIAYSYI